MVVGIDLASGQQLIGRLLKLQDDKRNSHILKRNVRRQIDLYVGLLLFLRVLLLLFLMLLFVLPITLFFGF